MYTPLLFSANSTIDFNNFNLYPIDIIVNPSNNTFLNAPTVLDTTFRFVGQAASDGGTYLQTITMASKGVIYTREYTLNIGWSAWINPASGSSSVTDVVSGTPELLSAVESGGTVTLNIVNSNQTDAPSNVFDYTKTDLYLVGNVIVDVSQMVLNRLYNCIAVGGTASITLNNGTFNNGGNMVSAVDSNSLTFKKVSIDKVNLI